jgi:hypothetical protein
LPLEEHIYELEGVFASIPVISPPVIKLSLVLVTIAKPLFEIKVVRALPNPVLLFPDFR